MIDERAASPEVRTIMRRCWRHIILVMNLVMIIQTVVIVVLVKLLPDI